jgi:hypothetical protein
MIKFAFLAVLSALIAPTADLAAEAEDNGGLVAPQLANPAPGQLLNQDYLTGTGATVPRPGVPQASGPTPLDKNIRQEDNRIDNSICTDC